jgi:carboxypeptidase Q
LIRSAGTGHTRDPHTGTSTQPKAGPLPSGAVSIPDAELIARLAAKGKPLTVSLTLTPKPLGTLTSGNVIADLPGRDAALPPILVACHLDSWDLGTGAIDDGAGCAIITAAALQASQSGQLARGIRVLWAGTEETGGFGGQAYAKAHASEPHAVVLESDSGADRVYKVDFAFAESDKALTARLAGELARMGITQGHDQPEGGEDVGFVAEQQKTAVIDLRQDATRYFDWHHTPDDTLDKIDPAQLQQNVDAWAVVLKILGNYTGVIAPVKPQ